MKLYDKKEIELKKHFRRKTGLGLTSHFPRKVVFELIYNIPFSFDLFVCFSLQGMHLCLCTSVTVSLRLRCKMYYHTLFSALPHFRPFFFLRLSVSLFVSPSFFPISVTDCLWTCHFYV